jgi:type 1 fimbriae regulatory protein FimE
MSKRTQTRLQLVQPEKSAQSRNLPPQRQPNEATRSREYLTTDEVRSVCTAAADTGRYGFRDALLIELMFRHGLRACEVITLTWDQVHFDEGTLHVTRAKNGTPATHYLDGEEVRRLRKHKREAEAGRFVFSSERRGPLTTRAVHKIVARAGEAAAIPFPIHPHMLRHAKGYQLAQRGVDTRAIQAYLGHRDIKSTVVYTQLDPTRFKNFGGW